MKVCPVWEPTPRKLLFTIPWVNIIIVKKSSKYYFSPGTNSKSLSLRFDIS